MKVLRLQCTCGRNLGDVRDGGEKNPTMTPDGLVVSTRPNVPMEDFRPWPKDPSADPRSHTYTWRCRCGRTPSRRHEAISGIWADEGDTNARVTRVID